MMDPVPRRHNRKSFVLANEALRGLAPFPFFGTLLGLTREADILKKDDDVDLYVEIQHRSTVIERLTRAGFGFTDEAPNTTPFFLQFTRLVDDITSYVDIYLYENHESQPWIVDRWNFGGGWDYPEGHLHVNKDILFPLVKKEFFGSSILMPRRPKDCCSFLYGKTWSKKLSKASGQYKVALQHNRPILIQKSELAFSLLQDIAAAHTELGRLRPGFANLTSERDRLIGQLDHLSGEHGALVEQRTGLMGEVVRLTSELDDVATQRDLALARADVAGSEAAQRAASLTEMETAYGALAGERDGLIGQRGQARLEYITKQASLTGEIDRLSAELAELRSAHGAVASERDELIGQCRRLAAEHEARATLDAERLSEAARLAAEVGDMTAQRDRALARADELAEMRVAHADLLAERDGLIAERDGLIAQRDGLIAERSGLIAERSGLIAQREAFAAQHAAMMGEIVRLASESGDLAAQRDHALARVAEISSQASDLSILLAEERAAQKQLLEMADTASAEHARLRALVEETRSEKDRSLDRLHAALAPAQKRAAFLGLRGDKHEVAARRRSVEKLVEMGFDGAAYRDAYPDVRESEMDPAEHYVAYGRAEGRRAWFKPPIS